MTHDDDIEADVKAAAREAAERPQPLDTSELRHRIARAHEPMPSDRDAQRDAWEKRLAERDEANGR
jgi:hypothetical protein